ncbi:MAG: class II aldolase/adducin family protein [Dehalococcoidia bacterium]
MTPVGGSLGGWRDTLIEVGRDLYAQRLVTSHGGNLSLRRPAGGALITATGAMLGRLDASTLVPIDGGGAPLEVGARAPSSNTDIHVTIYAAYPEVGAILHAHPAYATALSIASGADTFQAVNFEARLLFGQVPIVDGSGSDAPSVIASALASSPIVLVRGHGSFARGADLWQTLMYTTALEEAAEIATHAAPGLSSEGVPLHASVLRTLERDGYRRWEQAIAEVSPDATRADGWTLKEVVAHVSAWQQFAIERVRAMERGDVPRRTDVDSFNAQVQSRARAMSWDDVRAEAASAHEAFLDALASTEADTLRDQDGLGAYVFAVNGYGHYEEHLGDFAPR